MIFCLNLVIDVTTEYNKLVLKLSYHSLLV